MNKTWDKLVEQADASQPLISRDTASTNNWLGALRTELKVIRWLLATIAVIGVVALWHFWR